MSYHMSDCFLCCQTESVTSKEEMKLSAPVKPKIIVLKKTADGKSTEVDHQYVTGVKKEPHPAGIAACLHFDLIVSIHLITGHNL